MTSSLSFQGHKEPVASTFKPVRLFSGSNMGGPTCLHQKSPELQGLDTQLRSALTTADGVLHSNLRSPGSSRTVHLCLQAHSAHTPLMMPRMGMWVTEPTPVNHGCPAGPFREIQTFPLSESSSYKPPQNILSSAPILVPWGPWTTSQATRDHD